MGTVIQYIVVAAIVAGIVFVIAALVFGRGEQMAPLPARSSPSELPATNVTGDDVRAVRFGLAARGYRMSDVDWTLDRLAAHIDELHEQITVLTTAPNPAEASAASAASSSDEPVGTGPLSGGHPTSSSRSESSSDS